jgi:6-phosphogluconolactonase
VSTPAELEVQVQESPDELARAAAERLVHRLSHLQSQGRTPVVVLTGGSIAVRLHRAVLDVPGVHDVDWGRIEFWWGDERYLPSDDTDRNARQAREAFLSALPVDPARVHEMPASDSEYGDDVESAAAAHAEEVTRVLGASPRFDVLMLGVGPDGHCASLFPHHPELDAAGLVVAVHDSPKAPPTRISFTMHLLGQADEVWFVAAGEDKAQAVHDAVTGSDVEAVPASGPAGRTSTSWLLDRAAASRLPGDLLAR